ncbi:hypothetical protein ACEPAI_4428 [Sanghuangporus weigelae]
MPLLSIFYEPPFSSVDEVIDFMKQMLEGLSFMHENGAAHRVCSYLNVMMDEANLYPSRVPPGRFDDANNPRLVTGKDCQDKQLPELYHQDEPYDPFLVFLLGNVFKRVLVERYDALAFLAPLVDAITQE